jgi:hypothetical protein
MTNVEALTSLRCPFDRLSSPELATIEVAAPLAYLLFATHLLVHCYALDSKALCFALPQALSREKS